MNNLSHFFQCRWRCQWSVVTVAGVALVLYNAVANVWLMSPHGACPPPPPTTPVLTSCEPCADAAVASTDDDPISHLDLRLGRWDYSRAYKLFDYAAVGDSYADTSAGHQVCLATQSSIERLHELLNIANHWSGPISVAVFVTGDEMKLLRGFASWLSRCRPDVYARMALHVGMPVVRPGVREASPSYLPRNCEEIPVLMHGRRADTVAWRARNPYPQNHLRNLARKNCHTPYVFLVDIDIVPSKGMAEALDRFLTSIPKCSLCAYVVPTYELDMRVATFPANKSVLLRLSKNKLAIPFHRKVFIYNQYASNFSR